MVQSTREKRPLASPSVARQGSAFATCQPPRAPRHQCQIAKARLWRRYRLVPTAGEDCHFRRQGYFIGRAGHISWHTRVTLARWGQRSTWDDLQRPLADHRLQFSDHFFDAQRLAEEVAVRGPFSFGWLQLTRNQNDLNVRPAAVDGVSENPEWPSLRRHLLPRRQ